MYVNVTGIRPENISGNNNGYSYELTQILPETKTFLYKLTDPIGSTNIVELDGDAVGRLTADPEGFWKVNVNKES